MVSDDATGTFAEDNLNKSLDKLVVLKSERTYKERLKDKYNNDYDDSQKTVLAWWQKLSICDAHDNWSSFMRLR